MEEKDWYTLKSAVLGRHYSEAESLLEKEPELLDARNRIGETVLHYLSIENDIEGVVWLEKRGFNLNCKNKFGTPVVFDVALLEYKELLEWFYKKGANLSARNRDNLNIIEFLQVYEEDEMSVFVDKMYSGLICAEET